MNYQRDKVITIRVNSELLDQAQKIIDSYTTVSHGRGGRNIYDCRMPGAYSHWEKFSMADLFERSLKEFIKNTPINPGAK